MRAPGAPVVFVYALIQVEITGCISKETLVVRERSDLQSHRHGNSLQWTKHHVQHMLSHPTLPRSPVLASRFRQTPPDRDVSFLARADDEALVENVPVSLRHIITVALQMDIRKLNVTLLRSFREGVAAALDISPQHVHINRLNERTNGIELYVTSGNLETPEPLLSREVIHSLNINVLHMSLDQFGVTGVISEKNVLQGQHEHMWSNEGFYALVVFLTIFVVVVSCLMVLFRLKEKVELPLQQQKDSSGRELGLAPVPVPAPLPPPSSPAPVKPTPSMVHAEPAGKPQCSSPFRMKHAAGLQERRGSNVSLVLEMSILGSVEPLSSVGATTGEQVAVEYLQSASRTLSRQQLRDAALNTERLHAEFAEIPMNFVDAKELEIPTHGAKNRYKTILPNPHSRVILKTKTINDQLSGYINANYIRGYLRDEKAYIATQGPMINTVNDFWLMAWQERCPAIVMITKLKEKNEKCVLYWPEKRGIYGKVEVLVESMRECEHYTVRLLTLQQGGQSHSVKHYWYTSWPDHKTPESAQPLLQLVEEVEEDRRVSGPHGPVIVHCSAGIGRTGSFIATTIGCQQLQQEGAVDVLGIVCQLRADRGGMIQTGEQYQFVYHAVRMYERGLSADAGLCVYPPS